MTETAEDGTPEADVKATVERYGMHHLITYGTWQVTVDNVGMIRGPQIISPDTVQDLIGALEAAEPVALQQREDNRAAQQQMDEFFASQRSRAQQVQQERDAEASTARTVAARAKPAETAEEIKEATTARAKQHRASRAGGPVGARRTPTKKQGEAAPVVRKPKSTPVKKAAAPAKKAAPRKPRVADDRDSS